MSYVAIDTGQFADGKGSRCYQIGANVNGVIVVGKGPEYEQFEDRNYPVHRERALEKLAILNGDQE